MKVWLKPGETLQIGFYESDEQRPDHELDGTFTVQFEAETRIAIYADMPDTSGREGCIYEEIFSKEPGLRFPNVAITPSGPLEFDDGELLGVSDGAIYKAVSERNAEKDWQELEGLIHTMPYGEHEEAKAAETGREALGAAAALGHAPIPAKPQEPAGEPTIGNAGMPAASPTPANVEALANRIHEPAPTEDTDYDQVDLKDVEAYFQYSGASITLIAVGPKLMGFRLWDKNQYIGKWETGTDGSMDIVIVREADKALQVHRINN